MIYSGTVKQLEAALADVITEIFAGASFYNSINHRVPLNVYTHRLSVRSGDDDATDADLPEPYVLVSATKGSVQDDNSPHEVSIALVICCCDDGNDRSGHDDILHIINDIYHRLATVPIVGGGFVFQYPLTWEMVEDDTYPFYFGGMQLTFECAAVWKEDSLA